MQDSLEMFKLFGVQEAILLSLVLVGLASEQGG